MNFYKPLLLKNRSLAIYSYRALYPTNRKFFSSENLNTTPDLNSAKDNVQQILTTKNNQIQDVQKKKRTFDLGLFSSGSTSPQITDPVFERVESSYGSLILSKLPPFCKFTLVGGNVVGKADPVEIKRSFNGNVIQAAIHSVLGRKLQNTVVRSGPIGGDALLAPFNSGEIKQIEQTGSVSYYISKKNLFAYTHLLKTSPLMVLDNKFGSVFGVERIEGAGKFLVSSPGGLFKLSLSQDEHYFVDSEYVVCWDSRINFLADEESPIIRMPWKYKRELKKSAEKSNIEPSDSPVTPTSTLEIDSKDTKNKKVDTSLETGNISTKKTPPIENKSFGKKIVLYTKEKLINGAKISWNHTMNFVFGLGVYTLDLLKYSGWIFLRLAKKGINVPKMYRVSGPGDIYLTSKSTNGVVSRLKRITN
ncbi:hypothetical protein BB559_002779 [Furculomyces boomerangus]|uniref:Altered inheritance of mitochondria protein 24, mitochondrial n=2 Tax=Harpellales TaxID=61421 RepID=A0A2T9Y943_9FUNG|nr:hypothetical protein BB559_005363 [Furculomyces boomerangus]PVU95306.1 hypothetical protein BB559_002779 [Furculomyces boomerangus]PVZ98582.1 hypothetical protein BB558_005411 [Smittium angustum]